MATNQRRLKKKSDVITLLLGNYYVRRQDLINFTFTQKVEGLLSKL
jgi:hypothetical protein